MGSVWVRAQGDVLVRTQAGGLGDERDLRGVGVAGEEDQFVAARFGEGGDGVGDFLG